MIPAKLKAEIERWQDEAKYGHLQINFANGKIVNVNRFESIRMDIVLTNGNTTFTETGALTPGDTPNGH